MNETDALIVKEGKDGESKVIAAAIGAMVTERAPTESAH